jgi:predicted nuclease of predicted toxin-antitoxin system
VNIKLDENVPESVLRDLTALGHDIDTVRQEGLAGHDLNAVWAAAQSGGRFLITQDLDFSDLRRFAPGTHNGLLLVRLRQPGRTRLAQRLVSIFHTEDVSTWSGCFVIATDSKIRVRREP